ncbi:TetR/AcrR family transcriptional regulator [Brachybacterium sp.]|uniref:TetR/AcrR family transcriptional regulator n=1 Tax=Brachybacterium sp. TaxID=1891286 RepID=UPI002ED5D13D
MEAAERTLRARWAAQLSLRTLAREVGVSHAASRRHFPERQDLLDALAENGYARLRKGLCDAVAPHDAEFSTRIRRATSAFAHVATENPSLLELMNAAKLVTTGAIDVERLDELTDIALDKFLTGTTTRG